MLWAGACVACALAFAYGAFWARYAQRRSEAAGSPGATARDPAPQRRKLLAVLLAEKQQQQQEAQRLAAAGGAAPDGSPGPGSFQASKPQ
jgi:hypothetical protein